jgi:hypothetical protein
MRSHSESWHDCMCALVRVPSGPQCSVHLHLGADFCDEVRLLALDTLLFEAPGARQATICMFQIPASASNMETTTAAAQSAAAVVASRTCLRHV